MFGYVRIDKPELKVREYETYRAAYCGLCRSMGKCTGCSSRMTLSYDFAFLLIFRTVLAGEKLRTVTSRCPVHPLRKKPMLETSTESRYVSCAAALLLYYKCKDDLRDERGGRRLRARALFGTAKRMRKKALRALPALSVLDERISASMEAIADAENTSEPSVDRYAALSGELLSEIFAFGLPDVQARIAKTVGYHVGKWIYLLDAYDDLAEDRERDRFNPYLLLWGRDEGMEKSPEHRENVRVALLSELAEAEKAIDLVDFYGYADFYGVLRNILYGGMPKTAEAILSGEKREKPERTEGKKGNS